MTCNESDAALEIQSEILRLEQDFEDLGEDFYNIAMKRKMSSIRLVSMVIVRNSYLFFL